MKLRLKLLFGMVAAIPLIFVETASSQILFQENFDVDHTGNWIVNQSSGTHAADFFFDYSSVGIPAAPRSSGTMRGLKLQANLSGGVFGGLSVSPSGQSFAGDYRLRFDMWLNYNGPLNGGGNGSTQVTGAGIGTSGALPQWAGGTQDSVHFGVTGDGGSAADYRAYSTAAPSSYQDLDPVYSASGAGNRNNTHPYYAGFASQSAPAVQLSLFPQQTGSTAIGSQAFAWRNVVIEKIGNTATFSIDNTRIATVDLTTVSFGGSNILFNHYDINATSATDPNAPALLFGLIDNVLVEAIPEPGAFVCCAAGAGVLLLRRRRH